MAIRLVFVAGIVALAAAFAAWAFGGLSPLQALLFYVATGWTIILGGAVSFLFLNGAPDQTRMSDRGRRSVVVEVSAGQGR